MGTTIDGIGVSAAHWRHRTSALALADQAIERALESAGLQPDDVELLVNAGLYRDRNLGEPALAAMIQQDVGSNAEDPHAGGHGTFSFDVANGTCGPLTALQVIDGFLRAGTIDRAVVVASDADPGHGLAPDFPFAPTGAAAACSWRSGNAGLGAFHWVAHPAESGSFRSMVGFDGSRNLLRVDIDPSFGVLAASAAADVALAALREAALAPADVALAVVAPGDPTFVEAFAATTGLPSERIVAPCDPRVHTAGFLAALGAATDEHRLATGANVLFACAAAGITAGAVVYRVP